MKGAKGLPDGFDSQMFVGRRVDYVTFAEFTVFIGFDPSDPDVADGIVLTVKTTFEHFFPGSAVEYSVPDNRVRQSGLMRLCGNVVTKSDGATMRLTFGDGQVLSVPVDGGPYESFLISTAGREFVI